MQCSKTILIAELYFVNGFRRWPRMQFVAMTNCLTAFKVMAQWIDITACTGRLKKTQYSFGQGRAYRLVCAIREYCETVVLWRDNYWCWVPQHGEVSTVPTHSTAVWQCGYLLPTRRAAPYLHRDVRVYLNVNFPDRWIDDGEVLSTPMFARYNCMWHSPEGFSVQCKINHSKLKEPKLKSPAQPSQQTHWWTFFTQLLTTVNSA